ncbi:tetratricopeptide repeat protein [Metallibacterium scheffleri]|uniref:tetratricopeptide repeat protein n=1 Tax=Metallibacterium scheffleri TaxID=993689 RepID=UPI0023F1A60A|nr:tetratricopeptide repeat protein [Metallibacterium scheffleri]
MSSPPPEKPLLPERWWAPLGLLAVLLVTLWAYWPGLKGPFLFDDFGTLPKLGEFGPVHTWPIFWRYLTSGGGDPTGRPLALLSFLIDARNWPAAPWPFKFTNLLLQLINGTLLAALLWRLGRVLEPQGTRAARAAVLGAALWLLSPLFVSATLYVVQREAMLAAFFVLLGLLAYTRGRRLMLAGHSKRGIAWALLGLVGCTFLATFSKANGALLPALALVLEATIYTRAPLATAQRRNWRVMLWIFAALPALLLLAYFLWTGVQGTLHHPEVRRWTEPQRLLTEPRVLWDYLKLLWLPRPFTSGLFNDAFVVSRSLWHPADTLPALLGIIALIVLGWRWRIAHPLLALAILFYFTGMAMESTTIPLELYFEHRNYLPALPMFWPLAWWLSDLRRLRGFKATLSLALPILLALMTLQRATLWGHADQQAMLWAQINPHSARAQAYAAQFEAGNGQPLDAERRLQPLLAAHPDQVQLAFNLLNVQCQLGGVTPAAAASARTAMATMRNPGTLLTSWFGRALGVARAGHCPGFDLPLLQSLVDAGLGNARLRSNAGRQQDLYYVDGQIALARADVATAQADFEHALSLDVRPGFAAEVAAQLGSAGHPRHALALLDRYQRIAAQQPAPGLGMGMIHAWVLREQDYWPRELGHLRATLAAAAAARPAVPAHATQ